MEATSESNGSLDAVSQNFEDHPLEGGCAGHTAIYIKDLKSFDNGKFQAMAHYQGRVFSILIENAESKEQAEDFLKEHTVSMIQISISRNNSGSINFTESGYDQLSFSPKNKNKSKEWNKSTLEGKQFKYEDKLARIARIEDLESVISDSFNGKEDLLNLLSEIKRERRGGREYDQPGSLLHEVALITGDIPLTEISDNEGVQKIIKKARLYSEAKKLNGAVTVFEDAQGIGPGEERESCSSSVRRDLSFVEELRGEDIDMGDSYLEMEELLNVNNQDLIADAEQYLIEARNMESKSKGEAIELYKLAKEKLEQAGRNVNKIEKKIKSLEKN